MVKAAPVVSCPPQLLHSPPPPADLPTRHPPTPLLFPSLSLLHSLSLHPPTHHLPPSSRSRRVRRLASDFRVRGWGAPHRRPNRHGRALGPAAHAHHVSPRRRRRPLRRAARVARDDPLRRRRQRPHPAGVDAVDLQEKMALIPGWNATCLRLGPPSDEPLEPLDADGCVLRGVTELWCNRTHYDAEVTSTSTLPPR